MGSPNRICLGSECGIAVDRYLVWVARVLLSGNDALHALENSGTLLTDGKFTGGSHPSALKLNLTMKNSDGTPAFNTNGLRLFEPPAVAQDWTGTLTGALPGAFDSIRIEPYQVGEEVYSRFFRILASGLATEMGPIDLEGYFFLTLSRGNVYGSYELKGVVEEKGGFTGTLNIASGKLSFSMKSENGKKYTLTGKKIQP